MKETEDISAKEEDNLIREAALEMETCDELWEELKDWNLI